MKKNYTLKELVIQPFNKLKFILLFLGFGFSISVHAQCLAPTNIQIQSRTTSGATITWTAPTPAPVRYYYFVTTIPQPPFFETTTTSTSITISGYQPNTTLYVYLLSDCSVGDSDWVGPIAFSTLSQGSGCPNAPYGLYPTQTFTPTYNSTPDIIATDAYSGQYSNVNILQNRQYVFNSSVSTDYITITNSSTGILAHGPAPLVWNSATTVTSVIRYYITNDSFCNTEAVERTKTIKGQLVPGCNPPVNFSIVGITNNKAGIDFDGPQLDTTEYYLSTDPTPPSINDEATGIITGTIEVLTDLSANTTYFYWVRKICNSSTYYYSDWVSGESFTTQAAAFNGCLASIQDQSQHFIPGCFGNQEIISTTCDAGEFNYIEILPNKIYTFYSSVETDFISINYSNPLVNHVLASGTTPLVWSSGDNSGAVKFNTFLDAACDLEFVDRTVSIKCVDANPSCDAPNAFKINSITGTTANVSWTGSNHTPSNGYQYFLSTSNVTPISSATPTGSTSFTNLSLTNLNPNSTYYIWVRSNCGSSTSSWVFGNSFSTVGAASSGCTSASNGVLPATTFTPGCFGNTETILTNARTQQYSNIAISQNTQYTFSTSEISDYITITNADASHVYSVGTTPLVWNSGTNSGIIRYYIHANFACDNDNDFRIKSISCTDTPSCNPPSSLSSSAITGNGATLSWIASTSNPSNGYQYYFSTTNIAPTTATVASGNSGSLSVILSGLNPTTTYYFWVRSNCGNSLSAWAGGLSFTTTLSGCTTATNGLYPDEPFTPGCTGAQEVIVTDAYTSEYSNISISSNTTYTFSSSVASDFITISNANGSIIYTSGSSPLVWNSGANSGIIRYYLHLNTSCAGQNSERVKSILCPNTQSCNPPTSASISSIQASTAQLNWTAAVPVPSTGYDVYFNTINSVTPSTVPIGTTSNTTTTLSNLNPATTYYVWIRSNCGNTSVSAWVAVPSFTTLPNTVTGCTTAQLGLYPAFNFTPTCSGNLETITSTAYAGEYSNVNIIANKQYIFSSSVATDFITITNASGSVIFASGTSPLVWNSTVNSGVIRYFIHLNAACASQESDRIRSIRCQDVPPICSPPSNLTVSNVVTTNAQLNWNAASPAPAVGYDVYFSTTNSILPSTVPVGTVTGLAGQLGGLAPSTTYYFWVRSNCGGSSVSEWIAGPSFTTGTPTGTGCVTAEYGLYPTTTFTPTCSGSNETIVVDAYAGEYSNVNIIANKQYTFTSSVASDYITISNANATVIYASGMSPLIWNSTTNTGVIRYYIHLNLVCTSEENERTKSILCVDSSQTCNEPSNLVSSNVLSNSVQINWSAPSPAPASGYQIYYSTTNTVTPSTVPNFSTNGLFYNINNLSPATTYYFWIRSNCGNSNVSSWVVGGSFTTLPQTGTGCTNAIYGLFPADTFTPTCTGTPQTIVNNAYAGEYSNITVLADTEYTFSSSVITDYITITNTDASVIYTSGVSPLVWNSESVSGVIRYYLHTNEACGQENVNRTKSILCQGTAPVCNAPSNLSVTNLLSTSAQINWNAASPTPASGYQIYYSTINSVLPATPPSNSTTELFLSIANVDPDTTYFYWVRSNCGNSNVSSWVAGGSFTTLPSTTSGCTTATYGLYPTSTFTPNCSGNPQQIVIDAYAGEYTNVSVSDNVTYTFSSSVGTDFITLTNEDASIIYTSGLTPLLWNSGSTSGTIRYYLHINVACGEQNTNRIKYISCAGSTEPCAAPSNFTLSNITPITAQVSWSEAVPAPTGYNVYYSTTNTITPGTPPSSNANGTVGFMIDLLTATTYYVWVRSYCTDSGSGEWISAGSFTTLPYDGPGCISSSYGLYPNENFVPSCSGLEETIVTNAYAGEYSSVGIIQDRQYTFTSSVSTDYITITNALATEVYAHGPSPLVWNSGTIQENIRYLLHTDDGCGEENVNRTKFIKCSPLLETPNFEKTFAKVYPNPTKDKLNIVGDTAFDKVILLNNLGQQVKEVNANVENIQMDLSSYASGIYFIKVFQGNSNQTFKVVKE